MSKAKLHELLAVEADRESAAAAIVAETINTFSKKANLFQGKHSKYTPFDAEALDAEESNQEIVTTVPAKLDHTFKAIARALNVTAAKDLTNQSAEARAAIVIDDFALTPELPATTLLMLESKLKGWLAILTEIPTLAPGRKWELDADKGANIYRDATDDVKFRTKKVTHHKIIVEPTQHHPAQIHAWSEDERVGKVTESSWSGMMSPAEKSQLISRLQNLIIAAKQARQRANTAEVVEVDVAAPLISYLMGN
jgi:hypothetical protein